MENRYTSSGADADDMTKENDDGQGKKQISRANSRKDTIIR